MRQEFMYQLQDCGVDRNKLTTLMAEIDSEKRSLSSDLKRISSNSPEQTPKKTKALRYKKRLNQIIKIKEEIDFLTEEREMVRAKLGSMKMDKKALNKAANNRAPSFNQAFIAAAERILSEEQFLEIELRAVDILDAEKS